MIDLQNLEQYRENNRIEAKKALGGLPHSIWETYSAFANAFGGIILLGVEEYRDKTLHPVDLPDPEGMVREFWDAVNDPRTASVNVLLRRDVRIEEAEGKRIIVITVPRAQRFDRPVYVEGDPRNSFRRSGEGDYRCTEEERRAMYRDAARKTQDMLVLEDLGPTLLRQDSVRRYRERLLACHPEREWDDCSDDALLLRLGALERGRDGRPHPTGAGLLMFGSAAEIVREFPAYSLEYRAEGGPGGQEAALISSAVGDWSGNVFDFFCLVSDALAADPLLAPPGDGGTPLLDAVREALANGLINADYYGARGINLLRKKSGITLSNPGGFRVAVHAARAGGVSDPRNGTLLRLFNMIDVGKHAGSGIPKILAAWKARGWDEPRITERFNPDRILLTLPFSDCTDRKTAGKAITRGEKALVRSAAQKEQIIAYLTDHPRAAAAALGELLGVRPARVRTLLHGLIDAGIVVAEGAGRSRSYRLKA